MSGSSVFYLHKLVFLNRKENLYGLLQMDSIHLGARIERQLRFRKTS